MSETHTDTGTGADTETSGTASGTDTGLDAARERLARAQGELLSALVADGPVPPGFDAERLAVQARALRAKRADVVAKVAPELPGILGEEEYRTAFLAYAEGRPMRGNYRRDALDFAQHLLAADRPDDAKQRKRLHAWWRERAGPAPLPSGRVRRLLDRLPGRS
ncbi:hypothetical protein GCM10009801_43130 [Streptomyces albiaxialis]|uniref:SCO6045-like C-terminal domain-containing protein n=1 Tax=Streptomyces albiaxialis TaxID=329523 RepID=A0ABN2W4I6_9ACTN